MAVFFKVLFFNFIIKSENCPEYGKILIFFKQALSILLFLSPKNKTPSSDTYTKKIFSFTIFFLKNPINIIYTLKAIMRYNGVRRRH